MRRSSLSCLSNAFLIALVCLAPSIPALAQGANATVRGRLVDTDGVGIPGVSVIIGSKTAPTGNKQTVRDIEGNYRITLLPPADDYFIKIDYPGFVKIELGPMNLDQGRTTVQDITLHTTQELIDTVPVIAIGDKVDLGRTDT